jgi:inorganic triphosphatase YgiF
MGQERELKLGLTEVEARRLEARLGPPDRVTRQRNHYFDTRDGALRRAHCGLRLRCEDEQRYLLTVKGPSRSIAGLVERFEAERESTPDEATAWLAHGIDLTQTRLALPPQLAALAGEMRCVRLGALENERRSWGLPGTALTLEIDRTHHADGTLDCELELEFDAIAGTDAAALAWVRRLLADARVPWRPQSRGKLQRFLERRDAGEPGAPDARGPSGR